MLEQRSDSFLPKQYLPDALEFSSRLQDGIRSVPYHLRTIWLFTVSDLKTIVGPSVMFAILQQLGSASFDSGDLPKTQHVTLMQILKVVFWTWINLLPLDISNQRRSIDEDSLNKPWRPLPSGRITFGQANLIMLTTYPAAILYGFVTGALRQSIALLCLGYWYNDLGGANTSWIIRNFLNACGITCFLSGALMVMIQNQTPSLADSLKTTRGLEDQTRSLQTWVIIVWSVIFTSTQTQDMADQAGDALIKRRTMPLVLGDGIARWSIAIPVMLWTWFCLHYWSIPVIGRLLPLSLGTTVAWRTLSYRRMEEDKTTYKIWNLWLAVLFTLPLQRSLLA